MALLGIANGIAGAVNAIGSLTGGTSERDRARMAEADQLFNRALSGDRPAEMKLRCLAGSDDPSVKAEACRLGFTDACGASECGYATTKARSYAAQKVAELTTRRTIATGAGVVAPAVATAGMRADSDAFLASAGSTIASRLPSWLVPAAAIGAGVLLFLAVKRLR